MEEKSKRKNFNIKSYFWANGYHHRNQRNTAPIIKTNNKEILGQSFKRVSRQRISRSIKDMEQIKKYENEGLNQEEQNKRKKLLQKTINLYSRNLQFYKHNQTKLINKILIELKNRNFQHINHILNIIHNKKMPKNTQILLKIEQQLRLFNEFLSELYIARKKKQISVLKQNIKEEENTIFKKTNMIEYDTIYKQLYVKSFNNNNFDMIAHYQNICQKYGVHEASIHPYSEIKAHLQQSIRKIRNVFQQNRKQKQIGKFIPRRNVSKIL